MPPLLHWTELAKQRHNGFLESSIKLIVYPLSRSNWVAQSVKCPTSAQVKISWLASLSSTLGSVLTAQSLEPGACFRLCVCPSPVHALSLSLKNKVTLKIKKNSLSTVESCEKNKLVSENTGLTHSMAFLKSNWLFQWEWLEKNRKMLPERLQQCIFTAARI